MEMEWELRIRLEGAWELGHWEVEQYRKLEPDENDCQKLWGNGSWKSGGMKVSKKVGGGVFNQFGINALWFLFGQIGLRVKNLMSPNKLKTFLQPIWCL